MGTRVPLFMPNIGNDEIKAVTTLLKHKSLCGNLKKNEFEKKFARMVGAKFCCAVNSETSAVHIALKAAGVKAGDEVITSPFVPISTVNAIIYDGAVPVFVDIDPVSWNIDPLLIENVVTDKTKAVYAVHVYGQPCEMEAVKSVSAKCGLQVIENASYALSAKYGAARVGTLGNFGVFGFGKDKQLTSIRGAAVVTNQKVSYDYMTALTRNGIGENGEYVDMGYDYEMDELSATVGIEQIKNYKKNEDARRKIAELYIHELEQIDCIEIFPELPGSDRAWFFFAIRLASMLNRANVREQLARKGIETQDSFPCVHLQPFYKNKFGYKEGKFPIAEAISAQTLLLPFYSSMTPKEVDYIAKALINVIDKSL